MSEKVLCFIPTKDRYNALAQTIQSVLMQTRKPDALVYYDDGECKDTRKDPVFSKLFGLCDQFGIKWEVVFGKKKGQHHGHQWANTQTQYDWVWRIDDDCVAEPNVLEQLLRCSKIKLKGKTKVGAVGGSVAFLGAGDTTEGTNKMIDIYHTPNKQWSRLGELEQVEHLYSSFIYKPLIVDYNLELSPVAHREETLFTHEMFRKGYILLSDTSITTWHLRQDTGGIRSSTNNSFMWEHDERIFTKKMESWGYKLIPLNGGLGDHLVFSTLVPQLKEKYPNLILGCCYPEVFKECGVKTISYAAAEQHCKDNVYSWMWGKKWNKSIKKAFEEMYL